VEGAEPEGGVRALGEGRRLDDADDRLAPVVQRDHGGERRQALDELFGPVHRVEDPLERGTRQARRVLLAEDAVVWTRRLDHLTLALLDVQVGARHVAAVGLLLDLEAVVQESANPTPRLVSERQRQVAEPGDVGWGDPTAEIDHDPIILTMSSPRCSIRAL